MRARHDKLLPVVIFNGVAKAQFRERSRICEELSTNWAFGIYAGGRALLFEWQGNVRLVDQLGNR